MNKAELVRAVADKAGSKKKDAAVAVDAIIEAISEGIVTEGKVKLVGFGTFSVVERAAREGRNPATGEPMHIEASKAIKFKAGSELKAAVQ